WRSVANNSLLPSGGAMSRLQRFSLRAVVIFIISLSLIYSPVFSLRQGYAASKPAQSQAKNHNTHLPNDLAVVTKVTTFYRNILAFLQGGSNLATMRANTPQAPSAYQQTGTLPLSSYYDPAPTNTGYHDGYLTQTTAAGGEGGVAGSQPLQAADPTAGSASVG